MEQSLSKQQRPCGLVKSLEDAATALDEEWTMDRQIAYDRLCFERWSKMWNNAQQKSRAYPIQQTELNIQSLDDQPSELSPSYSCFKNESISKEMGNSQDVSLQNSLNSLTSADNEWILQLNDLLDFRRKHGHCDICYRNNSRYSLMAWVQQQREQYSFKTLPQNRVDVLNSIGFSWTETRKKNTWEEQYLNLIKFRGKYGHCNVSKSFKQYRSLSNWVMVQRKQYKQKLEGKYSRLTESHIKALNNINFKWSVYGGRWEKKYDEFIEYIKENGEHEKLNLGSLTLSLRTWVINQRTQYKLWVEGKPSRLRDDRIAKLNKINFIWTKNWNICSSNV